MNHVAEELNGSAGIRPAEPGERLVIESSALGERECPASVLIAPWGEVRSANGAFVLDGQAAEAVVEAFGAHGTDLPIDYEHQSLGGAYASPSGQAPAAGWIRHLRAVSPEEAGDGEAGLFADVEWTAAARQKLIGREYRYLSPVVIVRKSDRRVAALHSAALTNKPAIVGMKPIVNREAVTSNTSADDSVESIAPSNSSPANDPCPGGTRLTTAVESLRLRLELPTDAEAPAVLLEAEQRLARLMHDAAQREAGERVTAAMRAGKLTPAQRDWAMALAMTDPTSFDAWASAAPQVVCLGRTTPPNSRGCPNADRDRPALIASARAEFHTKPELALLTTEEAWVANALREAGIEAAT